VNFLILENFFGNRNYLSYFTFYMLLFNSAKKSTGWETRDYTYTKSRTSKCLKLCPTDKFWLRHYVLNSFKYILDFENVPKNLLGDTQHIYTVPTKWQSAYVIKSIYYTVLLTIFNFDWVYVQTLSAFFGNVTQIINYHVIIIIRDNAIALPDEAIYFDQQQQ